MYPLFRKAYMSYRDEGLATLRERLKRYLVRNFLEFFHSLRGMDSHPTYNAAYTRWLGIHGKRFTDRNRCMAHLSCSGEPVAITLILISYNNDIISIRRTISSVIRQNCSAWVLIISVTPKVYAALRDEFATLTDVAPRIFLYRHDDNHSHSDLRNSLMTHATSQYVAFLQPYDILWPHALDTLLLVAHSRESAHPPLLIYTDHDNLDTNEQHSDPYFKPDFSRLLLFTEHYTEFFSVFLRSAYDLDRLDSFGNPNADLWAFHLRLSEDPTRVRHVDTICGSRRIGVASSHGNLELSSSAFPQPEKRALDSAISRSGYDGWAEPHPTLPGAWRLQRRFSDHPLVSIIIASANISLAHSCIASIFSITTYPNFELVIVENINDPTKSRLFAELQITYDRVHVLHVSSNPFNYSFVNNFATTHAKGSYYCFLNDDVVVSTPDWIEQLLAALIDENYAASGGLLRYGNRAIQHAGITVGIGGIAGHPFRHVKEPYLTYQNLALKPRDVSGVTFACCLVRAVDFHAVGGLDEINVPLSYSDVDFCLRLIEHGRHIAYTPFCEVTHFESVSRGLKNTLVGQSYMRRRWHSILARDPFYNNNLTYTDESYTVIP